jgi:ABC-type nitrate/sulfonate/bicarbonate transport system substrate-binding protein
MSNRLKRKMFLMAASFLLFVSLSQAYFVGPSVAQETDIKVALPSFTANFWPLWIAIEKGFYREQGLNVKLILTSAGTRVSIQVLIAGEVEFAAGGADTGILAQIGGADLAIVAGLVNKLPFQIYAMPDAGSIKDLKGKVVTPGAIGGPAHYAMIAALKFGGLNASTDVKQLFIGNSADRLTALFSGEVSAATLAPPFTYTALQKGFKMVADLRFIVPDYQATSIHVRRSFIQKQPAIMTKFLRATIKGIKFLKENQKESSSICSKYTKQNTSACDGAYEFMAPIVPEDGGVTLKGIGTVLDFLAEIGRVPGTAQDARRFVDLRFR